MTDQPGPSRKRGADEVEVGPPPKRKAKSVVQIIAEVQQRENAGNPALVDRQQNIAAIKEGLGRMEEGELLSNSD